MIIRVTFQKYWAERPQPIEGESLLSWMIRTALANLSSLSSLFRHISINLKGSKYYRADIDLDIDWIPEIIEKFSEKKRESLKQYLER